jgi:hypothetical protein
MAVDPAHVSRTVADLLDHHGPRALAVAQKRVESASKAGDMPALDLAMMVLSEVEKRQAALSSL